MSGSLSRQRMLRRWHRRVAAVTSVQLLLWTLSGLYFAFIDIDYVRGHQFKRPAPQSEINLADFSLPSTVANQLVLVERRTGEKVLAVHSAEGVQWLSKEGAALEPLTEQDALALAAVRTVMSPDSAEWIDQNVAGSEYRGAPLPLWRLWDSANPDRIAYMDALSGQVVAVRHEAWRWWDFLWSLHIMNYGDRDTIGTLLLNLFSVLALGTAVLGLWLLIYTRRVTRSQ